MGYEASASASQSPYAPSTQPSATDHSPRRPSGVFRLFKRRYDENRVSSSGESIISSTRPQTPGADSVIGSLADGESGGSGKSLKKKSGTFWGRRKSSLSIMTGAEESSSGGAAVQQRNGTLAAVNSMRQQRAVSSNHGGGDAVFVGGEEEEFPPRLKQKKSLTFWRRTSSLGLDRMGSGNGQGYQPTRNASIDDKNAASIGHASLLGEDTNMNEPDPIPLRPRSPPPVLPEVGVVVQEKGGLMGGEDWFGDIR
ncbi:MAG: hypothetical protein L6R42_002285 [Xanthoria sp. 1 TBL-2021]|nr:MAG: hypothetical protein L6R42_002285 [Xanthoria sp. 1 TBL-2021]